MISLTGFLVWRNLTILLSYYIFEKQEVDLTPYLNKLSKKYNVVLYLFYYEGYSTKEMAELLHIKENNVRVLLNRARNQLRKEIEADEK